MPYSPEQCKKFAAMAKEGKKVPKDWQQQCSGQQQPQKKMNVARNLQGNL
jgi:hypothetical protein